MDVAAAASAYGPRGHSALTRAASRRRDGSSSSRVNARPANVASDQGTTMCSGGTPTIVSATSRGEPLTASATSARAAAARDCGAEPNSRARGILSSRTPRSISSRCDAPAQTITADAAVCCNRFSSASPPSPCHSPPATRSATITSDARAAIEMSVLPESCVEKPSTGAAWTMSRDLPAATRRVSSISVTARTRFDRASACASAPPKSPAPIMATSCIRCDIVMAMRSLRGQVALVTGGSRGIGLAIARALVADGVQVAITGRSAAHLSAARPKIEAAGPGAVETLQADVRRYDQVTGAIEATAARFGGLDILINNAGVGIFTEVGSMTPDQFSEVIETNLTGVFNACQAALPHLRRRGGGYIINISSLAGKNPFKGAGAYCASKAGLNAFSEVLMQEVRYDNIRVSYVMPGSVATGFSSGDETKGADWKSSPEDVAAAVVDLLKSDPRSILSRVELRPSKPPKK